MHACNCVGPQPGQDRCPCALREGPYDNVDWSLLGVLNGGVRVLGRCSLCGADVTVPTVWYGTRPPVPTCSSCGARKKDTRPTIEMEK